MATQTYFTIWAAMLVGMGCGIWFSLLLRPLSRWGFIALAIVLFAMAYATNNYGYLMLEPTP